MTDSAAQPQGNVRGAQVREGKSRGCLLRAVASVSGSQCFFLSNYFFYRFQRDHVTASRHRPIQSGDRHYPLCTAVLTH